MDERFTDSRPLVDDPTFRQYVRRTDPDAVQRWTAWLARNPDQLPIVREATRLVQQLDDLPRHKLTDPEITAELNQVQARLNIPTPTGLIKPLNNPFRMGRMAYWVAAASVVLISMLGIWFYTNPVQPAPTAGPVGVQTAPLVKTSTPPAAIGYQTPYGKRQSITLPDGSVVILNAHSSLRVVHWTNTQREVILRGEAFFRVSKKSYAGQPVKFVVRANNVAVEVLGTQFDISTRNQRVKVVLNEGHIRLKVMDGQQVDKQPVRTLDMLPGDLVELVNEQNLTLSSQIETGEHLAWVSNELVFDETPLSEVARLIEENYGYTVQFADPDLAKRQLTARLPDPSLDILLKALSKAFALTITQTNKTIRIAAIP